MLDLVISGGTVVDGTGAEQFRADVGVVGDRIVEVGRITTPARRKLDAEGLLVTPGFVDIHTHFDGQASWNSELAPSCDNGVTSVVMGNCGVGFAPARPDKHDWLINLLEGVEDIPGTALAEGLTWNWETFPEYLSAIEARRYTIDLAAYMPHAALRTYVMGERGADHTQHPTEDEIATMRAATAEALKVGAVGFSTSRTLAHKTRDGQNIGTLDASWPQLLGIAGALKDTGLGALQLISDAYHCQDEEVAAAELGLIRAMAEASGRPLSFTVMQSAGAPSRWRTMLDATAAMVRDGSTVRCQVAPRPVGGVMTFSSSLNPFVGTAAYQALRPLSVDQRLARLRDPAMKESILAEFRRPAKAGNFAGMRWDTGVMFRMTHPVNYEPTPDKSIRAEAARLGRDPDDYVYDVLMENDGRQVLWVPFLNYADGDLNAVHAMLTDVNALFGLSDAGAHVGSINDGTFPTTLLSLWGRGNRDGLTIPVEKLVHGYTQRNAAHVGWLDRGVVAGGYLADLNLIDLDALSLGAPHLIADLPAGGSRFHQPVHGYRCTIKRGQVTLQDGKLTGELPGRLMRGGQRAPAAA